MPNWVDLKKHNAALNVQQTQDGRILVIRATGATPLPVAVTTSLGFEFIPQFDIYSRKNLRFSLQEIRQVFPLAESREFSQSEIFWAPPLPASPEVEDPRSDPELCVGDYLADYEIDSLVDGIPVHFECRKQGGDESVWASAWLNETWHGLGDAWVNRSPTENELREAIGYVRRFPEIFDGTALLIAINQEIEASNLDIDDEDFRQPLIPIDALQLQKIDDVTFQLRFKDEALPFAVSIEQLSPGVYMPRSGSATGARTSLQNAVLWAVQDLAGAKEKRDQDLLALHEDLPRFFSDTTSFRELFGADGNDESTLSQVVAHYPAMAAKARRQNMEMPSGVTLTWLDPWTIKLDLGDAPQVRPVLIQGKESVEGLRQMRLWSAADTLMRGLDTLQEDLEWAQTKSAHIGIDLDSIANRYAEFMHSKDPERHNGKVARMHRSFAAALASKDYAYFIGWIARPRGQNDLTKKFFTEITGIKLPRTAKDITATLFEWAGYTPEQAEQIQREKAERRAEELKVREAEYALESVIRRLEHSNVQHGGIIKSARQFIDDIIADGFDRLETRQVGAVPRYRLVNHLTDLLYPIKGAMVDYARHVLGQKQQLIEQLETEDPIPELKLRA